MKADSPSSNSDARAPRRKDIRNIVAGICGSFISRNNDVLGYWALGKLYRLAVWRGVPKVTIDLLAESMSPADQELSVLVGTYRAMLERMMRAARLPLAWLRLAQVEVEFRVSAPNEKVVNRLTRGDLFKVTVTVTDDANKVRSTSDWGHCAPHDLSGEVCSLRATRIKP